MSWVNAIIQGILTGGLYALFACGLSLMFGVMKVVNLAHGDLAIIGGYIALGVITVTHIPVLWSFLIVVPIMAVLGYVLQRTVIQASLDRSILTTLLVTFGLSVVIGGLGSLWGTLLGGVVLGVAQQIGAQINPSNQLLAGYIVFLAVLVFRPQGLVARGAQS